MKLNVCSDVAKRESADVLVVPFWQTEKGAEVACKAPKSLLNGAMLPIQEGDFKGKASEMQFLYDAKVSEKRILLLGLGKKENVSAEGLRKAYSASVKAAISKKLSKLNILICDVKGKKQKELEKALVEGVFLMDYSYDRYKSEEDKKQTPLSKCSFIGGHSLDKAECERIYALIQSVNMARDLVNGNADEINPKTLCKIAKDLEKEYSGLKVTILEKSALEKEKMGLMLAVGRGASVDPALILVEYHGDKSSKDSTAIVGKGVTFDTGGLNLKPTGSIETMKCDMGGAAVVLGALRAAAALKLKANIIGAIGTVENAIGPDSYKPGDVYVARSGKTVEITNTDAEGRLVLADVLSYLQDHKKPSRIVDLATLTGAIVIALGEEASGLFSNDDALSKGLQEAGERTYERVWRLPLFAEYKDMLKSSIADIKNSAGRPASSITAALFLQEFIKDTPWAHLDIAGTAYLTAGKGYHSTPATGVGVRLLIDYIENLK